MCRNTGLYFVFTQQFDEAVDIYNLICQMSTQNHSLGEGGRHYFCQREIFDYRKCVVGMNLDKTNYS